MRGSRGGELSSFLGLTLDEYLLISAKSQEADSYFSASL